LLHLVRSSILLYLIDDARSNKNQVYRNVYNILNVEPEGKIPSRKWEGSNKADLHEMCVCFK